ncbi:hypothetical protein SRHO_G00011700 [Serrasalmus rhombeus]
MTSKQKKGLGGSIDDVLGDLLGDGDDPHMKARSPAAGLGRPTGVLPSRSGKRSLLDSYFKLAEEAEKEDEASDVSEADPKALLESMKDMDDMDADLFGPKRKPSSAPVQSKTSGAVGSKHGAAKSEAEATSNQPVEPDERKPSSAPAATFRGYKKFSFMDDDKAVESPPAKQDDIDDPLGDLLDDLDQEPKRTLSGKTEKSPSPSPLRQKKEDIASPAPVSKKREELTFDDDEDDLMDALGFSDTPKVRGSALTPKKESEVPQRARTRLDEILGIGTSPRLLERPATGEKKDRTQSERPAEKTSERSAERQPQKSSAGKDSVIGEEDFTFGSYQPTVVSTPEGRQSRRQSVRFSTEDVSSHSPERRPKPSTPSTPTTTRPARPASDWLGLKQDENENEQDEQKDEMKESVGAEESLKPPPSPSHESGKPPSRAGQTSKSAEELRAAPSSPKTSKPTASSTQLQVEEEKTEEDWLAGALSKRKTQTVKRSEDREKRQEESLGLGEEIELDSFLSKRNATSTPRRRQEDTAMPRRQPSSDSLVVSGRQQSPTPAPVPSTGVQHMPVPQQRTGGENMAPVQQVGLSSTQPQVTLSVDGVQQLLLQQQLAQAQLWGLGGPLELGSLQRQRRDAEQQTGEMTSLQAKIIQLEGQVRSLQLEKDQIQMLLDSVQQRHKQDTELMENTHRARVKLLEESAAQREARARQENEDLAERLATVTCMAEQERAELQAQNQRRLAQCQQDRDREVERLRDLQRKSILEMKKDHEEQVQRLKRLKDEEIDAVTSATSQTRSLTAVIEQMEQFSRRLGDLSSRVEITHENTAQGLELGARKRDEQLRVLQERLTQQQREMTEERARLKEVIAKMDTQLAEQQRQLQQERWRVTAEQAKAESALRGLEEERRSMMQHFAMEREELERAKSALLEEQQTVMQRCAEERRKLAAEWTQFHTQEKVRQDRAEREASRAMEREAHREGTIISIAQEQAELKLRAGELKQREDALQRERENLDKLREDLEREKEKLNAAALQLKSRAQEVESFSKLASERYEEGERALQEARQVETEHKARLRTIHTEMEQLRKQEQSLQQERMMMTDHCKEVERMRHSLPINPLPLSTAPILPAFASTQVGAPVAIPPPVVNAVSSGVSPELQATLALLRHTAEKDRDFLQDEQFFLDTLKKTPYNSAFHTA